MLLDANLHFFGESRMFALDNAKNSNLRCTMCIFIVDLERQASDHRHSREEREGDPARSDSSRTSASGPDE